MLSFAPPSTSRGLEERATSRQTAAAVACASAAARSGPPPGGAPQHASDTPLPALTRLIAGGMKLCGGAGSVNKTAYRSELDERDAHAPRPAHRPLDALVHVLRPPAMPRGRGFRWARPSPGLSARERLRVEGPDVA
ncbi:hypothetical protein, partial [Burkholderia pseudomallei]|uniref:hypothetical protein n=1 Tax=Burkholderia pseudomallei TaxID=28450 RepID=UPI001CA4F883